MGDDDEKDEMWAVDPEYENALDSADKGDLQPLIAYFAKDAPDMVEWIAKEITRDCRWRRVLGWGPHDNDDTPDAYPDEMDERRQEAKKALYDTLRSLPPDGPEAEKLRRAIANAKPAKFDKRRGSDVARIADELCDILEMPGESKAAKYRAYADEHGVDVSTVEKFVQRANRVLGLSKQK